MLWATMEAQSSSSSEDGYGATRDASLGFAHLFSFQVQYAALAGSAMASHSSKAAQVKSAAATMYAAASALALDLLSGLKKTNAWLNHGILQVNYAGGLLNLLDKNRVVLTQQFHALKGIEEREDIVNNTCITAVSFQDDEWKILPQCDVEKATLQHLIQSIMIGQSLEQAIYAGKNKRLLGLENRIIKEGTLSRKAKTPLKVDQRYMVLVPGKLFIFKTSSIARDHVRYVSTLIGGTVKISCCEGQSWEFQIFVPKTKDLTLIAATEKSMREWVEAIRFAIKMPDQVPTDVDLSLMRIKNAQDPVPGDSYWGMHAQNGADDLSLQQLNLYGATQQIGHDSNLARESTKIPFNVMPDKRNPMEGMDYQLNNSTSRLGQYQGVVLQGPAIENAIQNCWPDIGYQQSNNPVIEQGPNVAQDNLYQESKMQQGMDDGSHVNREAMGCWRDNAEGQQPASLGYSGFRLHAGKAASGDIIYGGSRNMHDPGRRSIYLAGNNINNQVTSMNDELAGVNKINFQSLSIYPNDLQDRARYCERPKLLQQSGDCPNLRGEMNVDQCSDGNVRGRDPQYQNVSGIEPCLQQTSYSGMRLERNIAGKNQCELLPYQLGVGAEQSGQCQGSTDRYGNERHPQQAADVIAGGQAESFYQKLEIEFERHNQASCNQQGNDQRPAKEAMDYYNRNVYTDPRDFQGSDVIKEQCSSHRPEKGIWQTSGTVGNEAYPRNYNDEQRNRDYTSVQNSRFHQAACNQQGNDQRPAKEAMDYYSRNVYTDARDFQGSDVIKEQCSNQRPDKGIWQTSGTAGFEAYQRNYDDERRNRDYTSVQNGRFHQATCNQQGNDQRPAKETMAHYSRNVYTDPGNFQGSDMIKEQCSSHRSEKGIWQTSGIAGNEARQRNYNDERRNRGYTSVQSSGLHQWNDEEADCREEWTGLPRSRAHQQNDDARYVKAQCSSGEDDDWRRGLEGKRHGNTHFGGEDEGARCGAVCRRGSGCGYGWTERERREFDGKQASSGVYEHGKEYDQREDGSRGSRRKGGFGNRY